VSNGLNARRVAWNVINAVHSADAYANLILPRAISDAGLDSRDAGLATELTYGTLRRQGSLDTVIAACAARDDIDQPVRDALRIGAYQMLFMRVPSHAAVDESVTLAKTISSHGAAKFVNAVLRRVSERDWDEWLDYLGSPMSDVDRLAFEYSYPVWVIRALADAYGLDAESVVPVLAAGNEPALISIVARPGQSTMDDVMAIEGVSPGRWSQLAGTLERSTRPGDIEAIRLGHIGVQDEGSQLVALAVAHVDVAGSQSHWLDMCAGPGGKAAILAGYASQVGARFTALEPIATRADLVANSLRDAPGNHEVIVQDARTYETSQLCDRILIDAPCTGLGALRRRPEARWRRTPSDVPVLTALQKELLEHASTLVRVGGVIGYATCSPHLAETDAVVSGFLRHHPEFSEVSLTQVLPQLDLPEGTTRLRLRPDIHGTDGMFLTILRRNDHG